MTDKLFQNEPLELRVQFLKDSADGVEEIDFMKEYTDEEIRTMEVQLKENTIESIKLDEKLTEYKAEIKTKKDPIQKKIGLLLEGLRFGSRIVTEKCYKFIDREKGIVTYYNSEGVTVKTRPPLPEERQLTVFSVQRNEPLTKTGTNI